ncbi:glycosyltransferase family 2 protein [Salinicoccus roseus]|uniref:glycosyltransferase family 2 protein n=1 Tax=Salinicoccus roseus TaxID=45670 RepID=UPI003DA18B4B
MYPTVSVICTVKNGEETLASTIKSVENQTYHNWEMIIVDDGSTDGTITILKEASEQNSRIKICLTGGVGRGNALNKGVDLARGHYITILDSDDSIHPKKFEMQLKVFTTLDNDTFLVSTDNIFIYDDESPRWETISSDTLKYSSLGKRILTKNRINHSSVMMRRDPLIKIGKYNSKRNSQLDYELWLRAHENGYKMHVLNAPLTAKRIHSNQAFENKKRVKYLYNSATLQLKYNLKLKTNYHLILLFPIRMTLGLLPFQARLHIKKFFNLS